MGWREGSAPRKDRSSKETEAQIQSGGAHTRPSLSGHRGGQLPTGLGSKNAHFSVTEEGTLLRSSGA